MWVLVVSARMPLLPSCPFLPFVVFADTFLNLFLFAQSAELRRQIHTLTSALQDKAKNLADTRDMVGMDKGGWEAGCVLVARGRVLGCCARTWSTPGTWSAWIRLVNWPLIGTNRVVHPVLHYGQTPGFRNHRGGDVCGGREASGDS